MAVIETGSLKTVHVIGDSHALAFKGKSITLPEYGIVANASVEYIPGLATDKLAVNRQLRPEIVNYFLRNGIITKEGVQAAATADSSVTGVQYATGMGFDRPMVMFICGEIFIRNYLRTTLANGPLVLSDVHETFSAVAENYVRDVASIGKSFGLHAVIHEICPPTADDRKFEEINKFNCPGELRSLVYGIFNTQLAEFASKHKLPVCRSWDYLAVNGLLDEAYEFDGVHADPKHAYASLERTIVNWLYSRGSEKTARYVSWCNMIDPAGYRPEISRIGVSDIFMPFEPAQIAALRGALGHFEELACPKPKLEWAHQPPTPRYGVHNQTITYGDVSPAGLGILRDVLIDGPLGERIRQLFGTKFSIINVRPVHSLPHEGSGVGQQSMHRDACPPGVFRALIYLSDVGPENGPFEYLPVGGGAPVQVHGKAGSTFVFDANAVLHRATPPRAGERWALDLIILAQPDACTEIVDCEVGLNWPIDPYLFRVSENCVPRLKADRWFYPSFVAPKIPDSAFAVPKSGDRPPQRAVG